jgi:hypothetical protein
LGTESTRMSFTPWKTVASMLDIVGWLVVWRYGKGAHDFHRAVGTHG